MTRCGEFGNSAHHLAFETLCVEVPFSGDDEIAMVECIVEPGFVGNEAETGFDAPAERHETTGKSASCS